MCFPNGPFVARFFWTGPLWPVFLDRPFVARFLDRPFVARFLDGLFVALFGRSLSVVHVASGIAQLLCLYSAAQIRTGR
jgi:hypothetical protein